MVDEELGGHLNRVRLLGHLCDQEPDVVEDRMSNWLMMDWSDCRYRWHDVEVVVMEHRCLFAHFARPAVAVAVAELVAVVVEIVEAAWH